MKPNILLITADQWRGDCLSAIGHPVLHTPNLDRLADSGTLFRRHYANAVPCSPARACLYTGLYQMNNRVCMNGSPLDARHDTLALAFRRLGYDPNLFGYTDQSEDPRRLHPDDPRLRSYEGLLPGFNWRACMSDDQRSWLSWLQQQGYENALQSDPVAFHIPLDGVDDPPSASVPVYRAEHTETAYLVGEFSRWLGEECSPARRQSRASGWFAHLSFLRPHPPFVVPPPYDKQYKVVDVPDFYGSGNWQHESKLHPLISYLQSTVTKDHFIPGTTGHVRDWSVGDLKQIAATYYGMCAEVDAQVGRLLDLLQQAGEHENTIVVFTSDHGEQLGDHHLLGKYGFFDQSFHVPLIISDPFRRASHGRKIDAFTEAVDVMPTLLAAVDADIPWQLDGCSLLPFLESSQSNADTSIGGQTVGGQNNAGSDRPAWRQAVHWEYDFRDVVDRKAEEYFELPSQACNLSVMRSERYKYVHFAALPPLLFDLEKDPHETHNVAEEPDYQAVVRASAEDLLSWRAQHLDQSLALSRITSGGWVNTAREPDATLNPAGTDGNLTV